VGRVPGRRRRTVLNHGTQQVIVIVISYNMHAHSDNHFSIFFPHTCVLSEYVNIMNKDWTSTSNVMQIVQLMLATQMYVIKIVHCTFSVDWPICPTLCSCIQGSHRTVQILCTSWMKNTL
jgi:hypothetical protein